MENEPGRDGERPAAGAHSAREVGDAWLRPCSLLVLVGVGRKTVASKAGPCDRSHQEVQAAERSAAGSEVLIEVVRLFVLAVCT